MTIVIPRPVHDPHRPAFRSRDVCFSATDWLQAGEAIKAQYPQSVYIRGATGPERIAKSIPAISRKSRLRDLMDETGQLPFEADVCFDPEWQPEFRVREDGGGWIRNPMPLPTVRILQYQGVWGAQGKAPEHLSAGRIEISCQSGNENHLTFARQFFALMGKLSTNKNQLRIRLPSYNVEAVQEKGSLIWLGHDAIRWAREDKRRLLCYERSGSSDSDDGWGLRPNDEGII